MKQVNRDSRFDVGGSGPRGVSSCLISQVGQGWTDIWYSPARANRKLTLSWKDEAAKIEHENGKGEIFCTYGLIDTARVQ